MDEEKRKVLALQVGLIVIVALWICLALTGVVMGVLRG
jgi:hypothetical protein